MKTSSSYLFQQHPDDAQQIPATTEAPVPSTSVPPVATPTPTPSQAPTPVKTPASVMKHKADKPATIADWLVSKQASFAQILPRHISPDRFMKIVISAIITTPALGKADPVTMLDAVRKCAQFGLEPDGRHSAIVPFKSGQKSGQAGHDVYDATFMVMVHGLIKLAKQTGEFSIIAAREVYKNDDFSYQYDFETTYRHVPAEGDRGELRGVYSYYVLKDGGRDFVYMSVADCEAWGKRYAKSFNNGLSLWKVDPRAAYLKTVVRKVLHFAPLSSALPDDADEMRNVTPQGPSMEKLPEMTFDMIPETTTGQNGQAE